MGVEYILNQFGLKSGLNPDDVGQRSVSLRFLNEAAQELYEQADSEGVLMEQLFIVNGDQMIALPSYVGPLRAMREYSTHVPWHLTNMRPRYNQINWEDRWRHWRIKGTSPLSQEIDNEGPVIISVPFVENPPIVINVCGQTQLATFATETFTMDSPMKIGGLDFLTAGIKAFKKDRVNNYDVLMFDIDGNQLSLLQNNLLESKYRIVDVSLYPWSNTAVGPTDHYMEVLFKPVLPWMQNDEDEYPVVGHDNIIVNKMCQIWAEEQGKGDEAAAFDAKATRSLARKKEDEKRGCEEAMAFCENTHDTLLPRNRPLGPSRYMGQIYY